MKYMGSKNRIAKEILPIILKDRKPGQWYVEPFVGGANMIDKVDGPRIGADLNPFVIEALKLIRDNPESLPISISEAEYYTLRDKKELNGVSCVIGFGCAFAGKFFNTYARGGDRNYMRETRDNALKQSPKLKDIIFINSSYEFLDVPKGSIIYCDPPYKGTTGYLNGFDHDKFWNWVRAKALQGFIIFVSEYSAPADFDCIWSKEIANSINNVNGFSTRPTEKLFIFNDLY